MKFRDFKRLPFNREFRITDGNYNYILEKNVTQGDNETIYTIVDITSNEHCCLFERTEIEGEIAYPIMRIVTSVGGISIQTSESYSSLTRLKIVPAGSFQQYMENTK